MALHPFAGVRSPTSTRPEFSMHSYCHILFRIYLAIDAFYPGSIQVGSHPVDRQTEFLYFSLVTLSTIGYGDIVPLTRGVRILAALEGVTGVLYIAATVALLVSRFRQEPADSPDLTGMNSRQYSRSG